MSTPTTIQRAGLVFLAAALIAACGGDGATDNTTEGGGDGAGAEQMNLEFPSFQADEPSTAAWWEDVIATFEEEHPGVTVDFSNSPGGEHSTLMATRFASDTPPEILQLISRDFVSFAAQDWLGEIDSCFDDDTLSEFGGLQSFMEWNDETQGLLLNSYAYHLYYNEALLDAAGVEVPTTVDELLQAASAVDEQTDSFGFAGITTASADAYVEASMFITGEGLDWTDGSSYLVSSPEFEQVIEQYRTLLSAAPQGLGEQERNELFFTGNAAMMLDGNYFWRQVQDESSEEVVGNAGIAPAPFTIQPGAVSNSLHIPAGLDDETRQLVCDFIATAARAEFQQAYGEAISVPPPRDGAVTEQLLADYPEVQQMIESKEGAESVLPGAQAALEQYGVFSGAIGEAMAELMATDRPTDEVLSDLQQALESEIPLG